MNQYEMILIFDPVLGEDKIGALVAKIEDKIKAAGGEIEGVEKWGTKKLASMIKRAKGLTQGYYVLVNFRSAPSLPAELRAFLKVTESVVRYFISRAVPKAAVAAPADALSVGEIKGEPIGKPE